MKTFEIKADHPDHKRIRIVCWSYSRNETRFDIQIDGYSILSNLDFNRVRAYAAVHILSSSIWVVIKANEALEILMPEAPPLTKNELQATLLQAVNVCESKYGCNSDVNGDAEVVFV